MPAAKGKQVLRLRWKRGEQGGGCRKQRGQGEPQGQGEGRGILLQSRERQAPCKGDPGSSPAPASSHPREASPGSDSTYLASQGHGLLWPGLDSVDGFCCSLLKTPSHLGVSWNGGSNPHHCPTPTGERNEKSSQRLPGKGLFGRGPGAIWLWGKASPPKVQPTRFHMGAREEGALTKAPWLRLNSRSPTPTPTLHSPQLKSPGLQSSLGNPETPDEARPWIQPIRKNGVCVCVSLLQNRDLQTWPL